MIIRGFYQGEPGALIVTGNLYCKTMELAWGDIVIMGSLNVEQYIFSHDPEFEQGSLHVRGDAHIPYIFKASDNPSYYFKTNQTVIKEIEETEDNPFRFYTEDDSETIFSADSYYQYLISKGK